MKKNTAKFLFPLLLFVLLIVYGLLKFASPLCIKHLYTTEQWGFLNHLAGAKETIPSLDFYLGTIEENIFGPLYSVIAGVILIILYLKYFRQASFGWFASLVFLFLILTKFEVLFYPAYGDPISGPWAEAVWLYKHKFDYVGLFHERNYVQGGPKTYLFTIYPAFLALTLFIIPTIKMFLVFNHLVIFLMSAVIAAQMRAMCQRFLGEPGAGLAAIALLALPVFQAMAEAMNLEIPTLFFVMGALYLLMKDRIWSASVMAILAVYTKTPGVVACATIFAVGTFECLFKVHEKRQWKKLLLGTLTVAAGLLNIYLRDNYVINTQETASYEVKPFLGVHHFTTSTFLLPPMLFVLGVLIIKLIVHLLAARKNTIKPNGWVNAIIDFYKQNFVVIIMIIGALSWFLIYMNLSVMGPRYMLLLGPFLLAAVFFAVGEILRNKTLINMIIILGTLVFYFCSWGAHYPKRLKSTYYVYGWLERSLEYRNDLKLHLKMAEEFKENFPKFTIGAPFVTAQTLAMPELGYVKDPLAVVVYGMSIFYGGIHNFAGIGKLDLSRTVWIGFESGMPSTIPYPIDPADKIIKEIYLGDKKATLFMGGLGIEKMWRLVLLNQLRNK